MVDAHYIPAEWMEGWMDDHKDGWTEELDGRDRRLGEWMMNDGWMDRRVDTWLQGLMDDGWMDGSTDGWKGEQLTE